MKLFYFFKYSNVLKIMISMRKVKIKFSDYVNQENLK